ncbi:MAG: hypothetical protein JXB48_02945 [Candidatus Latescibacteria bacterium]|nr:hypothetical protein [Candidatus Latescibacterota bacterium]
MSYDVTNIERGDYVNFKLHPAVVTGNFIAAGDTVGLVRSQVIELQRTQLQGELETELASLELYKTGEKESIIREAEFHLDYTRKQVEQQRREVARLQSLALKEMTPAADLERADTNLKLYEIQVDEAEAHLHTMKSGYKQQQIDWVLSRIHALQNEIIVLEKRLQASTMISPISGHVVCYSSCDTLAVIQDISRYVVVFPIKCKNRKYIEEKQNMILKLNGTKDSLTGTIERMSPMISSVNGKQMSGGTAVFEDEMKRLVPGMIVKCSISCPPVNPNEFLWRFLTL